MSITSPSPFSVILLLLLPLSDFQAIGQFNLSAEIRPRAEYRHGFKKLYDDQDTPSFFVEQQSRLIASYLTGKYKAGFVLQDVRIWGETAQINKTDGLSSLHEAWAEVMINNNFSAKVGRQELVYDDHRMLGNLDWAAQARSHDAIVFRFTDSTFTAHAGFAFNQDSKVPEPVKLTGNFYSMPGGFTTVGGGLPNYKNMQYVWLQKLLGKSQISVLLMNTGWQMPDTTVNYLLTAGINPTISITDKIRFIGSFYYQAGHDRADQNVRACLVSAALQFNGMAKAPITIGIDVVSGTKPGSQDSHTFDPQFGTNHAFYGHMDYFYVGNPHTQQGATIGLVDLFGKTTIKSGQRTSLLVHVHQFLSQVRLVDPEDPESNLSSSLGTEADIIFNYDYDRAVTIKLGYSQMFATRSMVAIKGGNNDTLQNWAWLMLTVKPSLLTFPVTN